MLFKAQQRGAVVTGMWHQPHLVGSTKVFSTCKFGSQSASLLVLFFIIIIISYYHRGSRANMGHLYCSLCLVNSPHTVNKIKQLNEKSTVILWRSFSRKDWAFIWTANTQGKESPLYALCLTSASQLLSAWLTSSFKSEHALLPSIFQRARANLLTEWKQGPCTHLCFGCSLAHSCANDWKAN